MFNISKYFLNNITELFLVISLFNVQLFIFQVFKLYTRPSLKNPCKL
jgi:hypothetical protein